VGGIRIGSALLITLTQLSHAAAEEGFLPFLADWIHLIAASLWMGGLLGFSLFLWGPLRAMTAKQRARLRWRAVRRFSKVATLAVMTLIGTGVYAILLHVPSVEGLLTTPYGRALMVKLGLAVLLLVAGGVNLVLEGRGPFGRIVGGELILAILIFVATGFLTTLPPASVAPP
jgi:copper transport protein